MYFFTLHKHDFDFGQTDCLCPVLPMIQITLSDLYLLLFATFAYLSILKILSEIYIFRITEKNVKEWDLQEHNSEYAHCEAIPGNNDVLRHIYLV